MNSFLSSDMPFKCIVCLRAFGQRSHLEIHQRSHMSMAPVVCQICGKRFPDDYTLVIHSRERSACRLSKPLKCEFCRRDFYLKSTLDMHMRIHFRHKRFPCDTCGAMFSTRNLLQTHSRSHTGVMEQRCSLCNKTFSSVSTLSTHEYLMCCVNPYECAMCKRKFPLKAYLWHHLKTHKTMQQRCFTCGFCRKDFYLKKTLIVHWRKHSSIPSFPCNICHRRFSLKNVAKAHQRLHISLKIKLGRKEDQTKGNWKNVYFVAESSCSTNSKLPVISDTKYAPKNVSRGKKVTDVSFKNSTVNCNKTPTIPAKVKQTKAGVNRQKTSLKAKCPSKTVPKHKEDDNNKKNTLSCVKKGHTESGGTKQNSQWTVSYVYPSKTGLSKNKEDDKIVLCIASKKSSVTTLIRDTKTGSLVISGPLSLAEKLKQKLNQKKGGDITLGECSKMTSQNPPKDSTAFTNMSDLLLVPGENFLSSSLDKKPVDCNVCGNSFPGNIPIPVGNKETGSSAIIGALLPESNNNTMSLSVKETDQPKNKGTVALGEECCKKTTTRTSNNSPLLKDSTTFTDKSNVLLVPGGNTSSSSLPSSPQKLFVCNVCKKSFTRSMALKSHQRQHSITTTTCCGTCESTEPAASTTASPTPSTTLSSSRTSSSSSSLTSYNNKGTNCKVFLIAESGTYKTNTANSVDSSQSSSRNNNNSSSGGDCSSSAPSQYVLACGICRARNFSSNQELICHIKKQHHLNIYGCRVCGKALPYQIRARKHEELHVA